MTTQAIIYTRFSPRPNADECKSIEKQKERCEVYCRNKFYDYGPLHIDRGVSGGTLSRIGLMAAIEGLKPGMVLVVDSSDRLARDMLVNLTIRHEVEKAGATIEYADGTSTSTTPEGTFFQNMMAAVDTYERDRIRFCTKRGLEKKRKNCEKIGGKIPIGWQLDPRDHKKLKVCLHERLAIIDICGLAQKTDHSSVEIAKQIDQWHGLCRNKTWSPRTIRKLIRRHMFWAGPNGDLSLEPKHP